MNNVYIARGVMWVFERAPKRHLVCFWLQSKRFQRRPIRDDVGQAAPPRSRPKVLRKFQDGVLQDPRLGETAAPGSGLLGNKVVQGPGRGRLGKSVILVGNYPSWRFWKSDILVAKRLCFLGVYERRLGQTHSPGCSFWPRSKVWLNDSDFLGSDLRLQVKFMVPES